MIVQPIFNFFGEFVNEKKKDQKIWPYLNCCNFLHSEEFATHEKMMSEVIGVYKFGQNSS